MGKRELLIIAAFLVAGAVAYQLTAPPGKPGEGFSFSRLFDNMRRGMQRDRASGEARSQQSIPVPATVREIRVRDIRGGVLIVGENRSDIAVEFAVQSTGPTPAEAEQFAKASVLKIDSLEDAIVMHVEYPVPGQQSARITLKIPKRLGARIDGSSGLEVSGIAAVQLVGVRGETKLEAITGLASGDYTAGVLQLRDVGSVDLILNNARTTIEGVKTTARLDVRMGRCSVSGLQGPAQIEVRQAVINLQANTGPVRIGGTGGRLEIIGPGNEVRVDVRRTDITVELRQAVAMSLSTADARLELAVGSPAGAPGRVAPVQVDAVAADGAVRAEDWQLTPVKGDRESRLDHTFGTGARVSLRNQHGDIVLKKLADVEIKKGQ